MVLHTANDHRLHLVLSRNAAKVGPKALLEVRFDERAAFLRGPHAMHQATGERVHVLISIPSTLSVAKSVQLLKGNSSKWIHDTFKEHWDFEWQEGYGAFSIGISGVEDTTKYIQGQAEHHRKATFREELEVFLKKHGMEYVERDLE